MKTVPASKFDFNNVTNTYLADISDFNPDGLSFRFTIEEGADRRAFQFAHYIRNDEGIVAWVYESSDGYKAKVFND